MCFVARWNGFAGRTWSPGRSLENPDTDYEEEWWRTHQCRSPTATLNSCDLTTSTRTQSSEQEYSYLTAQKRHLSTPYTHNTPENPPKLFTRNPTMYFSEVDKTCIDVFGMLPRFLKTLLENGNLWCSATAATKTALGTIQRWFNCFHGILAYTLPEWLSKDMPR